MQTAILSLFTRTPLHVGAGASVGAIDQPIIRERHTGFPTIPGSALKGVLVDLFLDNAYHRTEDGMLLFGKDDASQSGALAIGDAKLLAFPVRSARGCFAWLTSPMLLNRWFRDTGAAPVRIQEHTAADALTMNKQVLLEGYLINVEPLNLLLINTLKEACPDSMWRDMLSNHLMVVSDEYMSHFCTSSCEVAQHVRINDKTGVADDGALFNQENVPAETLFYAPIHELKPNALGKLKKELDKHVVLQIGADATTGLGICTTHITSAL